MSHNYRGHFETQVVSLYKTPDIPEALGEIGCLFFVTRVRTPE